PAEDAIRRLPDAQIWQLRTEGRKKLIGHMRKRYARQLASEGRNSVDTSSLFDANILTLGFARRFATYKRPNLLLHDPERLVRLLSDPQRPVQLILAGKAHPKDLPGQALIQQWNEFLRRPEVCDCVVFLSDYDMLMTQELVTGVDLWINTPRRPWEACGTSGMKVLVNGGLNLSELDGWWAEAYSPEVGWAIGDGKEHGEDPAWDAADAEELYSLLEREVIPQFYERDQAGMPSKWLRRVRKSMARLTPQFSAGRTIREYTTKYYLPASSRYRERASKESAIGASLVEWRHDIARHWDTVHFGAVDVQTRDGRHFFRVQVFSEVIAQEELRVELYADPVQGGEPVIEVMTLSGGNANASGARSYSAEIPATRPASDYTARLRPYHQNASLPLEASEILWQR
ncbi:MAG: alpha-glucan family phosphorylase, partial [Edaphobacter sp.]